jgi:hypothetical protein
VSLLPSRPPDVMKPDPVALASAFERALQGGSGKRLAELRPYLVDPPMAASCIKGGFEVEVAIFAKHLDTAFFVSLDGAQFGVGTMNEFGDIVESNHYLNITMAIRGFVGAISEP